MFIVLKAIMDIVLDPDNGIVVHYTNQILYHRFIYNCGASKHAANQGKFSQEYCMYFMKI